jgi:regulatory protein
MEGKITAIKAQKRNPNRINVYLDGQFMFGVSKIVAAWLQIGQYLDEQKINSLLEQDAVEVGFQKAIRLISYRPRSQKEIQLRLHGYGFSEGQVKIIMERLIHSELVKDERFAKIWVENRTEFRPRSHRFLRMELIQKGISEDEIQAALSETEDDSALAYQAAIRYARRLRGQEWREFRERLSAYLGRRGFDYGTISPVVRQVWEEVHLLQSGQPDSEDEEQENG